ncbi:protein CHLORORESPIRATORY REDUCTION 42, chloroplastic [Solanum dulcamara]|uniref:protein CHLORORESPIRATORY REDUCTION 42, chloroplastic n=1 Tax=Solanum dulcamara TaxID=45834 RepID=UPI002485E791|nr:protein CHLORORESPIRATORY REDUCTION 42, chloroplastic [Solanum dulcamara]XP_055818775.1 protein CHLORORESPIRATORY REDUCTION 42, chloroplastic [Solanum dulcamara]
MSLLSFTSIPKCPSSSRYSHGSTQLPLNLVTKCELNTNSGSQKLEIGSPIIVIESPKLLKTAASVPCLRPNAGLVKPGDVGRIVSRKPMDVWAVRLSIGTYLIDRKYFKPLELEE